MSTHLLLGNKGAHMYNGNTFQCSECSRTFQYRGNLQRHSCNVCIKCGNQFSPAQMLKGHVCSANKKNSVQIDKQKSVKVDKCDPAVKQAVQIHKHGTDLQLVKVDKCGKTVQNFYPPDQEWQVQKCTKLNLPLLTNHANIQSRPIAEPKAVFKTKPDGNCFFRCVSYILTGDTKFHFDIRKKLVSYMKNIERLVTSVTEKMSLVTHLQHTQMESDGKWATQTELFAVAHLLKTDICVYTKSGRTWKWLRYTGQFIDKNLVVHDTAIYLQHTGLCHYDVVTNASDNCVPLAGSLLMTDKSSNGMTQKDQPAASRLVPKQPAASPLAPSQHPLSRLTPNQAAASRLVPNQPASSVFNHTASSQLAHSQPCSSQMTQKNQPASSPLASNQPPSSGLAPNQPSSSVVSDMSWYEGYFEQQKQMSVKFKKRKLATDADKQVDRQRKVFKQNDRVSKSIDDN